MINELYKHCYKIKKRFLKMYFEANAGHIGCSLSCAEILTFIYSNLMQLNDEFVLSKGHAAAVLYSTLAEFNYLNDNDLATFYKDNTFLAAHPPGNFKIPQVRFATGSLGHGLSLASGITLGARLKNENTKTFCLTSDGELNEGSIWEAAMFASQHTLSNLYWFIDRNFIQGFGKTEDIIRLEPLAKKIEAFGWDVYEVNGHSFAEFLSLENKLNNSTSLKPKAIICYTTKGHGISYMENTVACHYLPMTAEQYGKNLLEIEKEYKMHFQENDL